MSDLGQIGKRAADLAGQSGLQNRYTFTGFLSPEEQDAVIRAMEKTHESRYAFFGGAPPAVRAIAVFGSEEEFGYRFEPPFAVVHIAPLSGKFAENLNHRDYLGALMSLGLDRSTMGDIIIRKDEAWLICLDTVSDYIIRNLTAVRHTSVRCSRAEGKVPQIEPRFEERQLNVVSERLDAVVSAVTGLSRGKAQELIRDEKVFVNGRCITGGSRELKQQEVLTIRGFGKLIYDGVTGVSRKGRYYITIRKYL